MIGDAIEYPVQGEDALVRLVNGGVIALLASVLIVPGILIGGYSVAVCRSVLEGRTEPPAWGNWRRLAVDGLYVVAITLVYWLPGLLVGAVGFGLGVSVLAGTGDGSAVGPALAFLLVSVGSLLGFGYALLVSYILPAAIVNFARTGELNAAWDLATLRTVAGNPEYAKAWVVGVVLLFAFNSAGSSLVWLLVGFLVLFFGQVTAMYVFTRGTMAALGIEPTPPADAGHASGQPTSSADDPSSTPEGPQADDDPTAAPPDDPATSSDGDAADPTDYITGPGDDETAEGDDQQDPAGTDGDADSAPEDDGSADRGLEDVAAIEPAVAEALRGSGFETVQDLRDASRADLAAVDGVGPATANRIKSNLEHL